MLANSIEARCYQHHTFTVYFQLHTVSALVVNVVTATKNFRTSCMIQQFRFAISSLVDCSILNVVLPPFIRIAVALVVPRLIDYGHTPFTQVRARLHMCITCAVGCRVG